MTYLKIDLFAANWQRISNIKITSSVKNWFFGSKNATVSVHHGFYDISVDLSGTFVGNNGYVVMVNVAPKKSGKANENLISIRVRPCIT